MLSPAIRKVPQNLENISVGLSQSESIRPLSQRAQARVPIQLRVAYERLNSFFADYTKNISRGGTFIRTNRPLPVGTDFVFHLALPGADEPLNLKGRVQWIVTPENATDDQEPGMGIGFLYDSEADRQRIEGAVEQMMIRSLGPTLYEKLIGHRNPT